MIIIPKVSMLFLLMILSQNFLLLSHLFDGLHIPPLLSLSTYSFEFLLFFSGSLSLFIGTVALNNQWKIKRFFAYSGVSHVGFILLALYCYDLHSYLLYTIIYGITTFNIFAILLILSQYQGKEILYISQLTGISGLNPFLSIALAVNLLSLAGVC